MTGCTGIQILSHLSRHARRYFLTLLNTGCRLSEIQKANVGDVDLEAGTLRIVRKGGKPQTIGLNDVALSAIREELSCRTDAHAGEPLFLNRYGKRYKKIRGALAEACRKGGVPHVTHHSLRHAYATMLRKSERYTIEEISRMLGHVNVTVTQNIYLHWREEEIIETARRVTVFEKVIKK